MKTILITGIGGLTPRSIAKTIRRNHPDYKLIGIDVNKKACAACHRVRARQTHPAAAAAGVRGRGAAHSVLAAHPLCGHGRACLLDEPAVRAAGLCPRLGGADPV